MTSPYDFLRLQPVVTVGDRLLMRGSVTPGSGQLVMPSGKVFALSEFCSMQELQMRILNSNRKALCRMVESAIASLSLVGGEVLRVVVEEWIPAFQSRDFGECAVVSDAAEAANQLSFGPSIDSMFPAVPVPSPALWVHGRAWPLVRGNWTTSMTAVNVGRRTFVLSGEYWPVSTLEKKWQQGLQAAATAFAERYTGPNQNARPSTRLANAREQIARTGAFEKGDLLFLSGNPPRLGCMIPPHENIVIGHVGEGQVAITTALRLSASTATSEYQVYRKTSAGRWEHFSHILCLGTAGHFYIDQDPALATWAHLRWAAERIATNRRFHVNDGVSRDEENYSNG